MEKCIFLKVSSFQEHFPTKQGIISPPKISLPGPSSHTEPALWSRVDYKMRNVAIPVEAATSAAIYPDKPSSCLHDGDMPSSSHQFTLTRVRGGRRAARDSWLCPAQSWQAAASFLLHSWETTLSTETWRESELSSWGLPLNAADEV